MRLARLLDPLRKKGPVSCASEGTAAPDQNTEKRRYPRLAKDYKVEILDAWDKPTDEAVRMVDMSPSGVGIECHQTLCVGQILRFRMTVENQNIVDARARVRWTRPLGFRTAVGLEIEGMNFLARRRVERTLDEGDSGKMTLPTVLTLLLQFASSAMALYVLADWLRSNPNVLISFLLFAPYVLLIGVAAYTAKNLPRN